jgi:hypothetical protein
MARAVFDHLMHGGSDLESLVDEFAARTGAQAVRGGSHAGTGTHNALISLGEGRYLELIAPIPGHHGDSPLATLLAGLATPRNILWAARTDDIEVAAAAAKAQGYDPGGIIEMSRTTPGGTTLSWRLTFGGADVLLGVLPFLIQWTCDAHPAARAPTGCILADFRAEHPRVAAVQTTAAGALGVAIDMRTGSVPALIATLETPRGRVELR